MLFSVFKKDKYILKNKNSFQSRQIFPAIDQLSTSFIHLKVFKGGVPSKSRFSKIYVPMFENYPFLRKGPSRNPPVHTVYTVPREHTMYILSQESIPCL